MVKDIITDLTKFYSRSEEINVKEESKLLNEIIENLKDTMVENKDLISLSAPQIGYYKRVFVVNFNGDLRTFINPFMLSQKELFMSIESNASIPEKKYLVPRTKELIIAYQTPTGANETNRFLNEASAIVKQNIDILDGVMISDWGVEFDKEFEETYNNSTEEERKEFFAAYLKSLDKDSKKLEKEIDKDEWLKKEKDAIKFMTGIVEGTVKVEQPKVKLNRATRRSLKHKFGIVVGKEEN